MATVGAIRERIRTLYEGDSVASRRLDSIGTTKMIKSLFLVSATLRLMVTPAIADGNVAAGEIVFQRCVVCHGKLEPAQSPRMGPPLHGIVGRPVASVEGYAYSDAMKAFGTSGAQWDEATLDQFLKEPILFVKGTKMMAPPVRRDAERADLIAYLKSQPAL